MNNPTYPQLHPDIRLRRERFGGMMYIPQENSLIGRLKRLNESSFIICQQFTGEKSIQEICQYLQGQGLNYEKAQTWVDSLITQMTKDGYVTVKSNPSSPKRPYILGRTKEGVSHLTHLSAPIYMGWEITYTCNLNCKHCYNVSGVGGDWEPSLTDLRQFVDKYVKAGVYGINLGGGEPLLRDDVIDIVHYADQRGIRMNIDTNATQVTHEIAQNLKKAGLRAVHVSIDGSTSDIHDEFRETPGALESTVKGVKRLQKAGFSPVVRTVVSKLNIDDLEKMDTMLMQLDIKYHVLTRFLPLGRGKENRGTLMTTPEENKKAFEYVTKKRSELRKKNYFLSLDETFPLTLAQIGLKGTDLVKGLCPAGVAICMVATDGTVIPCPYFRDYVIGNLRERTFIDIWDDPALSTFRRDEPLYQCAACENFGTTCAGGCRGFAYVETGDMLNADPGCWILNQ
jgi:radical SAM protein with 4Fe4S-binding SPASM domain